MHVDKYNPLRGGSYVPLPKALVGEKAIINVKNDDEKCFFWCVLGAFNLKDKNNERIDGDLKSKETTLNMTGIEYPVSYKGIDRFEKNNPGIFIKRFRLRKRG